MATDDKQNRLRDKAAENRVKGKLDEVGGKLRGTWGDATDDSSLQFKGKVQELKGKLRQGLGKAQEKFAESAESDDEPESGTP